MPRLSNKKLRKRNNKKGSHQRRRSTRGGRTISKFIKYKFYGEVKDGLRTSM